MQGTAARSDTEVLLVGPLAPRMAEMVAEAFPVHELPANPRREAFLAEVGDGIRAIATGSSRAVVDKALLDKLPNLEIISSFGVGHDHIDLDAAQARRIAVTTTPDILNDEVADTAIALLLSTIRQIPRAEAYLRSGLWPQGAFGYSQSLRDRCVGILGLGRIGAAIARRLEGFDVPIAYHGRTKQIGQPYRYFESLEDMAAHVDTLIIAAPGGSSTERLVDEDILRALGPRGVLINIARGSIVDESALIEALQSGTILAAGLDVFANEPHVPSELLALDQLVLLPHIGSASEFTRGRMIELVIENLRAWDSGQQLLTPL